MKKETYIIKRYSEALKLKIVSDIESGELSRLGANREYGIPRSTIMKWVDKYGSYERETKIVMKFMCQI